MWLTAKLSALEQVSSFDESIIQNFHDCMQFFILPENIYCLSDTYFEFRKSPTCFTWCLLILDHFSENYWDSISKSPCKFYYDFGLSNEVLYYHVERLTQNLVNYLRWGLLPKLSKAFNTKSCILDAWLGSEYACFEIIYITCEIYSFFFK